MKVLCFYSASHFTPNAHGQYKTQGTKMIEVGRLSDIEEAFDTAMYWEAEEWRKDFCVGPQFRTWRLLGFMTEPTLRASDSYQ